MGYFSNKKIAEVAEPIQTTLANSPNFVVFSSENTEEGTRFESSLQVKSVGVLKLERSIVIIENPSTGVRRTHLFKSTYDPKKVNDDTFLMLTTDSMSEERALSLTTQNLKECLEKNTYLKNNFDITLRLDVLGSTNDVLENNTIKIVSKGCGEQYQLIIYVAPVDVTNVKGSDFIVSLKELDYSNLDMSKFKITMFGHQQRMAVTFFFTGVYEVTDYEQFKVVLPSDTISEHQAKLETLRNLFKEMSKIDLVIPSLNLTIDEDALSVYCEYKEGYDPESGFNWGIHDIESEYEMIEVKRKIDTFAKIDVGYRHPTHSNDTIDYGTGKYKIALDVYTDHGQSRNIKESSVKLGNYVTTLSKSYFGRPLWFDLNALLSKKVSYSPDFLTKLETKNASTWCDAGTMTDYRFVAKRTDGVITESFFYSDPMYVINGYNSTLEPIKLENSSGGSAYIIDFDQDFHKNEFTRLKPLTTKLTRTHIKGQRQYYNFIHNFKDEQSPSIGICYKLYTQMGTLIGEVAQKAKKEEKLHQVNTTLLKLDDFLPLYKEKTVGRIDVSLSYKIEDDVYTLISTPMSFRILPEVLNTVNDFVFLNQLGGWDSVNFGGDTSYEFKVTSDTIYKTLQNDFTLQSEIESVSSHKIKEQKVVKTSPITKEDVLWLRQMSASPAVYELSTKRYILIDDMALKYNSSDDLYQVEMKYHYTDTFNTQVSK